MKTPEEIKKGLEICAADGDVTNCARCPYDWAEHEYHCVEKMLEDAIAYIQQLESAQPKWISVEEPPKQEGQYIVRAIAFGGAIINSWDIFTTGSGWCGEGSDFKKILFYMSYNSLPEPPKEET